MKRLSVANLLLIPMLFIITGCFPHTSYYKPVSSWEKKSYERASRDIFPEDVKGSLATYHDTVVAWPGIIIENKFVENQDDVEIQYTLEHHYYDWLEDFSIQKEKIFLSPKGEGIFRTFWKIKKEPDSIEEMKNVSVPGNLIIVYGIPDLVNEDGSITLKSIYIRIIEKKWYRTDILNYGRPGQPVSLKKVPFQ